MKFYSLKTIENICSLTTVAKQYFASNDDFHKYYYEQRGDESERDFSYLKKLTSFEFRSK